MTATLEERLFSIISMVLVSLLTAGLPFYLLGRRRLNLRRDVFFLFFWFQSWIYLHLVPTLNVMFPESAFAFPFLNFDLRAVRYTEAVCRSYVFFQIMTVLLFYLPLLWVYAAWNRAASPPVSADGPGRISRWRMLIFAALYSGFSLAALSVAVENNYLSAYADLMTIETLAVGQAAAWQYYLYRLYLLSGMFLAIVAVIMLYEYCRQEWGPKLLVICATLPGLICWAVWIFCRSRALLAFTLALVAMGLIYRGGLPIPRRWLKLGVVLVLAGIYLFAVIIKLRGYVLEPEFGWAHLGAALNPFEYPEEYYPMIMSNYGLRLDGLETMVLTFPQMLEKGLVLGKLYLASVFNPLLNFVPGLKMQVFEQYGQVDFRMEFIREYTGLEYQDYAMNGLTDIYAALGLAGFLVAGVVYALLLVFVSRRLAPGRSGAALLLGIFILCQMYSFEVAFATLPFGWTKSLPVLLVVLAINPYRVKVPRRQPNPAS